MSASFFERFSTKKKNDEKESKRRAEKKQARRRSSSDKRSRRQKNERGDEQNDNKRDIEKYKHPPRGESPSGQLNQGYSKDNGTILEDEEISL